MNLGDALSESQREREAWIKEQHNKEGDYSGDSCPNCSRARVMVGDDGKHHCEKCAWCVEDGGYDHDFVSYIYGL